MAAERRGGPLQPDSGRDADGQEHPLGFLLHDGRSLALDDPSSASSSHSSSPQPGGGGEQKKKKKSNTAVIGQGIKETANLITFHANEAEEQHHVEEVINLRLDDEDSGPAAVIVQQGARVPESEPPAPKSAPRDDAAAPTPTFQTALADRLQPPVSEPTQKPAPPALPEKPLMEKPIITSHESTATQDEPQPAAPPPPQQTTVLTPPVEFKQPYPRLPAAVEKHRQAVVSPPRPHPPSSRLPYVATANEEASQVQPSREPSGGGENKAAAKDQPYSTPVGDDLGSQEILDGYDVRNNVELYNIANPDRIKTLDLAKKKQQEKPHVDWTDGQPQPYPLTSNGAPDDPPPAPRKPVDKDVIQREDVPWLADSSNAKSNNNNDNEQTKASRALPSTDDDGGFPSSAASTTDDDEHETKKVLFEPSPPKPSPSAIAKDDFSALHLDEPSRPSLFDRDRTFGTLTAADATATATGAAHSFGKEAEESTRPNFFVAPSNTAPLDNGPQVQPERNPADDPAACVAGVATGTLGAISSAMGTGARSADAVEKEATLSLHERRVNALVRIRVLERMGKKFDRKFDMHSDPEEMHAYADAAEKVDTASRGLDTSRKILIGVVGVIEYLNSVSPVKAELEGWSSDVMANIDDYDAVLLKIWERLMASKGEMSPYWELVIMLGVSAGSYHVTQKMVKDRSKRLADQKRREAGLLLRETDDGGDSDSDSDSESSSSSDEAEDDDDDEDIEDQDGRQRRVSSGRPLHFVTAPFVAPPTGYNPAQFVPYATPYWAAAAPSSAYYPPPAQAAPFFQQPKTQYAPEMQARPAAIPPGPQPTQPSAPSTPPAPLQRPSTPATLNQQQQQPRQQLPRRTPTPAAKTLRQNDTPQQRLADAAAAAGLNTRTPSRLPAAAKAASLSASEEDLSEKEQGQELSARPAGAPKPKPDEPQPDFLAMVQQLAAKQGLQHEESDEDDHVERNQRRGPPKPRNKRKQ